ncbi:CPSF A subunit region [Ancylostoma ceylanicum]|uniref:CPSF A subunit region n=1 Tax=Ancylostoma ceylanicum TaxID=53326 RepID=A0A0D6M3V7_9BILA|nr:CPSF A subunit region [Ancylostoma ceylanicum]
MYSYLFEKDDSTTVNFSSYGRFLPGKGNQLLTVGAKHLRLFRTNPYTLIPPKDASEEWKQKTKLECVYSCRFMSPIQSFAKAKLPGYPSCEALLLAFEGCNVSVVAVDPEDRALSTISLHSFSSEFKRDGFTHHSHEPIVRADPANRCGAVVVYDRVLGILPFEGDFINSFSIPLSEIDHRLENIVDMIFLDGYYEPTLLFLYEPHQTTAGRASVRYDTMHLLGVSVNVFDEQVAIVWQVGNLPMDCNRLVAIPKPLGGVLVIGSNEVIYLNQSVPPCGISLNSCYDNFTKFPLKDLKHMSMTLDAGAAEWIGDNHVALGTMDGKLFILTLVTDSSETVRSLDLEHVFDTSIAYCMNLCTPGRLFIGSRLGDSQLLEFTVEKEEKVDEAPPESKKPRIDEIKADDDDLELYGEQIIEQVATVESKVKEKLVFSELDRLTNIGPVKAITAGGAHGISPILLEQERVDPIFDILINPCLFRSLLLDTQLTDLSVYYKGRYDRILQDAQQLWAVGRREDDSHKYLIVSRTRSSLILELGEDMVELEEPLFLSDEPTVAAGELADGGLAVQEIDISNSAFAEKTVHHRAPLTALSIYRDMSGLMVCSQYVDDAAPIEGRRFSRPKKKAATRRSAVDSTELDLYGEEAIAPPSAIVDEDELLYGDTGVDKRDEGFRKRKRMAEITSVTSGCEESDAIDPNTVEPTYWLILARDSGKIVIHSLPDMSIVYQFLKFGLMPEIVTDLMPDEEEKDKKEQEARAEQFENSSVQFRPNERVVELQIVGLGINQGHPTLMAVIDDQVIAYEMFKWRNPLREHLSIGFRRLSMTVTIRSTPFMGQDGRRADVEVGREIEQHRVIIHPFERVCGIVYAVTTSVPMKSNKIWVVVNDDKQVETHEKNKNFVLPSIPQYSLNLYSPMDWKPVPNTDIKFEEMEVVTACEEVTLRSESTISGMQTYLSVYAVTTSVPMKSNKIWVVVNDDKQVETHEKNKNFVLPSIPQYSLNLYSPMDWKPVPNTDIKFEEMEVVTACEEVTLRSESTISGMQTYLSVGTINNYGEEVLVRGRIILAEIIDVVPEPGKPTSKHKIKVVYDKEQKGPVTALASINGLLLSGMAQKVFIWGFRDNDLQGISFLDMHYYVHSLVSMRNIAIACDMHDSMSLIRFQEQFKALSIASRDDRPDVPSPMAAQFLVDNSHLAFLMSDEAGNICLFNYMPETQESNGGERLILRGVLNVGTNVNAWLRVKGHTSLMAITPAEVKNITQQQTCVWASLDGSVGIVRPISERQFRRLHFLHQCMSNSVGQLAGLNPKGARGGKPIRPLINATNTKNMVDGELVEQFMHLSTSRKQDLARSLGASRYHIMDDLVQIQRLSTFY